MDTNTKVRDLPSDFLEMTVAELMAAFTPSDVEPVKVKKSKKSDD